KSGRLSVPIDKESARRRQVAKKKQVFCGVRKKRASGADIHASIHVARTSGRFWPSNAQGMRGGLDTPPQAETPAGSLPSDQFPVATRPPRHGQDWPNDGQEEVPPTRMVFGREARLPLFEKDADYSAFELKKRDRHLY